MLKFISKNSYVLISVMVFVLPMLLIPIYTPSQKYELRKFSKMPTFQLQSLWDVGYYSSMSEYLRDRLPPRNIYTFLRGAWLIHVFDSSPNNRVRVGRDGYYYLTDAVEFPCQNSEVPDSQKIWENLDSINNEIETKEGKFYISFAPQKATIYREKLSDFDQRRYQCALDKLEIFKNHVHDDKSYYINLWPTFIKQKDSQQLHHKTDSHWNENGSLLYTKKILNILNSSIFQESEVKRIDYEHLGDLGRLMGYPLYEISPRITIIRDHVKVKKFPLEKSAKNYIRRFTASSLKDVTFLGKAVVFHDSYGLRLLRQLPPYFNETIFIHHEAAGTNSASNHVKNADYVFFIFAERFMYNFAEKLDTHPINEHIFEDL